jgi:hypothetical protein
MDNGLLPAALGRIKPLVSAPSAIPGHPAYTATCFEGSDWSLKPLQRKGDEDKAPELARRISRALAGMGARLIFAPTPTKFNGELVSEETLMKERLRLGNLWMYRNPDVPADGAWLPYRGCAGIFSAGGCSLIVATRGNKMIFAHAGRDCVIDRTRIRTQNFRKGRRHESIVNGILNELAPSYSAHRKAHEIRAAVYYSIRPEEFRHDLADKNTEHAEYNEGAWKLLPREYGEECGIVDSRGIGIDVPRIIRRQFIANGVPPENISLEHAYLRDELPTTRRGDGSGRYLVAVVRNS